MKRSAEKEMMDLPGQPRELLVGDLANLRVLNRFLGCHRNVLRGLARLVREQKLRDFSLLDVGTGSGDIPGVIARWARQRRLRARITAIDREAVSVEEAVGQTRAFSEISLLCGDGAAPPFSAASFDFVLASQMLHHLPDDEIVAMLRNWARLARRAIIISDLVRHPLPYYGISLISKAFTRNAMTLRDAPLSVRRALTLTEWARLLRRADVGSFHVQWMFPFRVLGLISLKSRP